MADTEPVDRSLPPPPYQVRVHKSLAGPDRLFRLAADASEVLGWFHNAVRTLGSASQAAGHDRRTAAELGLEPLELAGHTCYRILTEGVAVYLWVEARARTVHILHAAPRRMLTRYGRTDPLLAERNLAEILSHPKGSTRRLRLRKA